MEGGRRIPVVHDGFIMWSQGAVSEPPEGLPKYEVSFYDKFPEERIMYIVVYEYDPSNKKGYIHLPGWGERGHDVDIRSIYRGVEGKWFHAAEDFDKVVQPLIVKQAASAGN